MAVPQTNLPLVTLDGHLKLEHVVVLDTRTLPRRDEIITQWKNLSDDHTTWEDKFFIKASFPEFYSKTIREWWPQGAPCGQVAAQEGGIVRL
jgi:hypothetical protein